MTTVATPSQSTVVRPSKPPVNAWFLHCPTCRQPLSEFGQVLGCWTCDRRWPIRDQVAYFDGADRRPHVLTSAQRLSVAQQAQTNGWEAALHDHLRLIDETTYRRAIDEYHAQWRLVLPLSSASHVLDLSSGWGALAFNLAESCEFVAAADPCAAHAQFVALRAQQMRYTNILALRLGLDQPLPFAERHFDAVVLIDGLAWVGDDTAQRALLQHIHAVLRPGGCLLLAEANALARRLSRPPGIGRFRTLGSHLQLLRSCGFRIMQTYAPAPSHLEPFFMIPLDQPAPLAYMLREIIGGQNFEAHFRQRGQAALYPLARALIRRTPLPILTKLFRLCVPSLAIIAQA
jgi:SAM-dependent methyltransferase